MKGKTLPGLRHSIFIKLLIIIVSTGVMINLLVAVFFRLHLNSSTGEGFRSNIRNYVNYLIKDIGIPPDVEKAEKIAGENHLYIRINGSGISWASSEESPALPDLKKFHFRDAANGIWYRGMFVITAQRSGISFLFATEPRRYRFLGKEPLVLLVIILSVIVAVAYFSIRRLLRGVRSLSEGVSEISKGNFNHRIRVSGRDEIAELTASFNSMSLLIKEMLASKEQLLLDVSHELRSPLTRIKVGLEFLPEGKARESITEDISDIERMITGILESERLNAPHGGLDITEGNICELVRETVRSFDKRMPGIVIKDMPEEFQLKFDQERTGIVIRNIVENSLKYSSNTDLPVEISFENDTDGAVLIIKDVGIGIAPEDINRVFEPFYRADPSRSRNTGGYGLGLSLCGKIMEAQGGSIDISSVPGAGTTVRLRFSKS